MGGAELFCPGSETMGSKTTRIKNALWRPGRCQSYNRRMHVTPERIPFAGRPTKELQFSLGRVWRSSSYFGGFLCSNLRRNRAGVKTRYSGGTDIFLVGAPGFEPGTSCAQGKRATRLRHAPTTQTGSLHYKAHSYSAKGIRPCPARFARGSNRRSRTRGDATNS